MEMKSKVYVLLDGEKITRCEGGYGMANIDDLSRWVMIDEGFGPKYNHCQTAYFAGGLYTFDHIPRYKYIDGEVMERTEEEIAADRAAIPTPSPTAQERLEAQVTYTAMMTDTLIPEV